MLKKAALLAFACLPLAAQAAATWAYGLTIERIRLDDTYAYVKTETQPSNTCSLYGEYFMFDHTTSAGPSWLSSLMMAQAASLSLHLHYTESTTPDTDHNTGCTQSTVSKLYSLRVLSPGVS